MSKVKNHTKRWKTTSVSQKYHGECKIVYDKYNPPMRQTKLQYYDEVMGNKPIEKRPKKVWVVSDKKLYEKIKFARKRNAKEQMKVEMAFDPKRQDWKSIDKYWK